jgi:hypothetical protein
MSFTVDLSRIVKKAGNNVENTVRKVCIETFAKVILKSPVDTGRFRANWNYSVANYDTNTNESTDTGGGSTVAKVTAGVAGTRIDGRPLYLVNNLPYSIRLENGYSKQAPAGMVKLSLLEITAKYGT